MLAHSSEVAKRVYVQHTAKMYVHIQQTIQKCIIIFQQKKTNLAVSPTAPVASPTACTSTDETAPAPRTLRHVGSTVSAGHPLTESMSVSDSAAYDDLKDRFLRAHPLKGKIPGVAAVRSWLAGRGYSSDVVKKTKALISVFIRRKVNLRALAHPP